MCRFCGRAGPEVKFKKQAHAIPDQVGNDWLFDCEVCDTCNGEFAKWTHPWRALGRVKGKKVVPSIKSNEEKFCIDTTMGPMSSETGAEGVRYGPKVRMGVNVVRHELGEATRTVKINLDRPACAPMGVVQCLVKIAIAIMPPEDEKRYAHLKK